MLVIFGICFIKVNLIKILEHGIYINVSLNWFSDWDISNITLNLNSKFKSK
jgi:hypothetical protein